MVTNAQGNTGAGGPLTDSDSVNITVNHVDVAPVVSLPGAQTMNENTTLNFSSAGGNLISVSDADAAGGIEQVTLSVTQGTLTLAQTTGLLFSQGTGAGDGTMTFTGTIAN